jgi:hypothetical protein
MRAKVEDIRLRAEASEADMLKLKKCMRNSMGRTLIFYEAEPI